MAAAGLCAFALAAACVDELAGPVPGTGLPAPVTWMSWIGGIGTGENLSVRLLGTRSGCGPFVVHVEREGTHIRLWPEDAVEPGAVCLFDVIVMYDTTIVLAGLPSDTYTMEALSWDAFGMTTRTFGTVSVVTGGVFDALLKAGGHGHLLADSLGCSWARPLLQIPSGDPYVLSADVSLPAGWHGAFVSGAFVQSVPRCGHSQLYQVAVAEVNPLPGGADPAHRR